MTPYEIVFGEHAVGVQRIDRKTFMHERDQKVLKELEQSARQFRARESPRES